MNNYNADTGIYILMLEILLQRFLRVIILAALIITMFGLAFYMAFNSTSPLLNFKHSPFATPLNSIWKTMTMMTGELDYESIFRVSSEASEDEIPALQFPEISYILWIVCIIIILQGCQSAC